MSFVNFNSEDKFKTVKYINKMKIIIKSIVQSNVWTFDVDEHTLISDIKKKIEQESQIPASHQTLVLFGKTLQDDKTVSFYPKIKDGTKLYLAKKKAESLDAALKMFLKQYYSDQQCERIVQEFMKDFHNKVKNLSLDDLERIAETDMLHN